jgi:octaprenyl-diphosphate synthase
MWNGDKKQAKIIHDSISNGGLENINLIKDAINSTGAISYTAEIAKQESELAIDVLNQFPSSEYLDALHSLAKFSVERHS